MAPPQDAKTVVTTTRDLNAHFEQLKQDLSIPETEHSWQKLDNALVRLQAITRGGATKFPEYVGHMKQLSQPINNSLLSERTKLSGTAADLINSVAPRLAEKFDSLVAVFVPTLLSICARTNKVAVKRAEKCLQLICKHCRLTSLVPLLKQAIKDKSQGLRAVAASSLVILLELISKDKLNARVAADIEQSIKSSATDSHPQVRQISKKLFEIYVSMWPERVENFTKPFTPTIRRYLALPKTGALVVDIPISNAASSVSRPTLTAATPTIQSKTTVAESHRSHGEHHNHSTRSHVEQLDRSTRSNRYPATETVQAAVSDHRTRNASEYQTVAAALQKAARLELAQPARPLVSSTSSVELRQGAHRVKPLSKSTSRSPHPLSASVGAPIPLTNRPASGSLMAPSFSVASGLHGKSALLAAYNHAFSRETPSFPERSGNATEAAGPSSSCKLPSSSSSLDWQGVGGSHTLDDVVGMSDHAPSGDANIVQTSGGGGAGGGGGETTRPSPSDGVAERLALAKDQHLRLLEQASLSSQLSTSSAVHTPSPFSMASDGAPKSEQGGPFKKASRVMAQRAPLPNKVSAARVVVTPSVKRVTCLKSSINGSTPSIFSSSLHQAPKSTSGAVKAMAAPPPKAPPQVAKPPLSKTSTDKPKLVPSKDTAKPVTEKKPTSGKPRLAVISASSAKTFQPAVKGRSKVMSSVSASYAPKSKLVGPSAAASDKANLVKKASQARAALAHVQIEQQRRQIEQVKGQDKLEKKQEQPIVLGEARDVQDQIHLTDKSREEGPNIETDEPTKTEVSVLHGGDPAPTAQVQCTPAQTTKVDKLIDEAGAKRTPLGTKDANVPPPPPIRMAGEEEGKGKKAVAVAVVVAPRSTSLMHAPLNVGQVEGKPVTRLPPSEYLRAALQRCGMSESEESDSDPEVEEDETEQQQQRQRQGYGFHGEKSCTMRTEHLRVAKETTTQIDKVNRVARQNGGGYQLVIGTADGSHTDLCDDETVVLG